MFVHNTHSLRKRTRSIDFVIYDQGVCALNRTDNPHCFCDTIVPMPALLNYSKGRIEAISQLASFLGKALIGCNDRKIVLFLLSKVTRLQNLRGQFIYGYIEEPLDLTCMHIHRQYSMRACNGNTIGDQAGGDWYTRLIFLVSATIRIVGDDSSDTGSRGTLEGIYHDQQFHDRAIDRSTERLNNKNIATAHIIIDFHKNIFIAELKNICVAQRDAQMFTYRNRQRAVRIACKNAKIVHSLLLVPLSISHRECLCKLILRGPRHSVASFQSGL